MAKDDLKGKLLDAALPNVAFDGWSDKSLAAAAADIDISLEDARAICPRGAVDLALEYHDRGDTLMEERLGAADFADMRFRDKVAEAVKIRLEVIDDKEAVRRAATLFALPHHAGDSAKTLWQTADKIWNALGDTSEDYNWYTKRATLSGVWAATVLFWLGDESEDFQRTRDFIDRRIDDVMQIERVKGQVRKAPVIGPVVQAIEGTLSKVKFPMRGPRDDLPGIWNPPSS